MVILLSCNMAINRRNFNPLDKCYLARSFSKSITVPDQALSIVEIFDRLRAGMSLDTLDKGGYYDDPYEFDEDFDTSDDGFNDYSDYTTGFEVPD